MLSEILSYWLLPIIIFVFMVGFGGADLLSILCLEFVGVTAILVWFWHLQWFDAYSYIVHHPSEMAGGIVVYFSIGIIYSFLKWFLYLRSRKDAIQEAYGKYKDSLSKINAPSSYEDFIDSTYYHRMFSVSYNKNKFIFWIVCWIPSALHTIFHDLVKEIANGIYNLFKGVYEKIHDSFLRKILK